MKDNSIKNNTISGLIWRFAERCGAQGVTFIVSIILARVLSPDDYGSVALVTVLITILQVFVDSGMGSSLIQKKNADDLDFSTVFFFNIVMCSVLYLGMFISAPWIAKFYNNPELTPVIRVLTFTIVISGVKNIQQSYVSKHLLFKRFFFSTLGGTIGAAIVGITMAYLGFGIWALVFQHLFNDFVNMVILWFTVKWRPKFKFSFSRLKSLFSFGWKLLLSNLINTVYNDIRQLIIGKMYSPADLGFYNRGKQFPSVVVTNINASIDSVLFPVISKYQDDTGKMKAMTRRAIKTSSYIMWPLMFGIMAVAEPLISVILTDKWLPAVPYLRIFCFSYGFFPIHTANLNAIKAKGRSDLFLKLEIEKKIVGMVLLLSSMWFGVMAMAYTLLISTVASSFINASPNKKLINYSYKEQIVDMLPAMVSSAVMAIMVYCISFIQMPNLLLLVIQVIAGAVIYVAISIIFKIETFSYLKDTLFDFIKKLVSKKAK